MSVVTTLLAPPLLRIAYKGAREVETDGDYRLD
jgi:hypothetical protein